MNTDALNAAATVLARALISRGRKAPGLLRRGDCRSAEDSERRTRGEHLSRGSSSTRKSRASP